jgi:D,D-heptose 1,7-bisphosphate phosphatase
MRIGGNCPLVTTDIGYIKYPVFIQNLASSLSATGRRRSWPTRLLGVILLRVQPAVFLDRDNTLIVGNDDLGDPEQVRLTDGAAEGVRALRNAGYAIVVVTNQGGVARGKFAEEDVDAVNQRIAMLVDEEAGETHLIDRFYYCPYHPEAAIDEYRRDHPWRKPHPGMLLQAARDLQLDLSQSWLIGDQARDVQAGRAAGCRTVLITHGTDDPASDEADVTEMASSFAHAVEVVLRSPPPAAPSGVKDAVRARARSRAADHDTPTTGPSNVSHDTPAGENADETRRMRRAVQELMEELRADRLHRSEFTSLRLLAVVVQLLVLLCVLLGLLEVRNTEVFLKWMSGALLVQLAVIALLLVDLRR